MFRNERFDDRRDGGRPYDRAPRNGGRYQEEPRDRDYYDRAPRYDRRGDGPSSRYDNPRGPARDRSPIGPPRGGRPSGGADRRMNGDRRGRRRTLSSSRSRSPPPVYAGRKDGRGDRSPRKVAGSGGSGKVIDEAWSDAE